MGINPHEVEDVPKLEGRHLDLLLEQFYGKTLPEENATSKAAKAARWVELKAAVIPSLGPPELELRTWPLTLTPSFLI